MRLIEPLSLSFGAEAVALVKAGLALPFGDGGAFAVARLIEEDGSVHVVLASDLSDQWSPAATLVGGRSWAGLPPEPLVMGVLNVTPDSFSDGGRDRTPAESVARGLAMIEAGAAIIDIGGETTRPGASEVSVQAELDRVLPVLEGLRGRGAKISVDTRHAAVMRAVLAAGADIINDVSALTHDPEALGVLAAAGAPEVLMHMRGDPRTMDRHTDYRDVAVEVTRELAARIALARQAGLTLDAIAVDPGVGFAKTAAQSAELLRRLGLLTNLGVPIVLGASRKRFVGQLSGVADAASRLGGSVAAGLAGVARGARVIRAHDVAETVQALRLMRGVG